MAANPPKPPKTRKSTDHEDRPPQHTGGSARSHVMYNGSVFPEHARGQGSLMGGYVAGYAHYQGNLIRTKPKHDYLFDTEIKPNIKMGVGNAFSKTAKVRSKLNRQADRYTHVYQAYKDKNRRLVKPVGWKSQFYKTETPDLGRVEEEDIYHNYGEVYKRNPKHDKEHRLVYIEDEEGPDIEYEHPHRAVARELNRSDDVNNNNNNNANAETKPKTKKQKKK